MTCQNYITINNMIVIISDLTSGGWIRISKHCCTRCNHQRNKCNLRYTSTNSYINKLNKHDDIYKAHRITIQIVLLSVFQEILRVAGAKPIPVHCSDPAAERVYV